MPPRRLCEGRIGAWVIICVNITLGHLQNLAKRCAKADSGTFSDLIHLLEGVEKSELVPGGRDTPEVVAGSHWVPG